YVMSRTQAFDVLSSVNGAYRVLDVNGVRLNRYQNLYFDTPDFALYQRHHAGKPRRYKVRSRAYVDSNLAFFEIKQKDKRDRTIKSRIKTPDLVRQIDDTVTGVVADHLLDEVSTLVPTLWNRFTRVTLVNTASRERVTLDFHLQFAWGDQYVQIPSI